MRQLNRWDLVSPQQTLNTVVTSARPQAGDVVVVTLVVAPEGAHEIVDITTLDTAGQTLSRRSASELLRRHVAAVVLPREHREDADHRGRRYLTVLVVCREGRTLPGRVELFWSMAWNCTDHLADTFHGDVYMLTPHGWTGCHDRRAGLRPALEPDAVGAADQDGEVVRMSFRTRRRPRQKTYR